MENLAEIQSSDEYKMIMQSISMINDAISSLRKIFSYIHAGIGIEGWQLTELNFCETQLSYKVTRCKKMSNRELIGVNTNSRYKKQYLKCVGLKYLLKQSFVFMKTC